MYQHRGFLSKHLQKLSEACYSPLTIFYFGIL